ncbi:HAD-IIA family hydrolase [Pueribacillus sp. YX66]|uniref:HAD-IIA family hydrolase n=1 Tax=Pueribacillus sp. YX66 TaxID=3229242 RepID=UPI00358D4666
MIASQFDLFLFDLDGVVYVGPKPLPGAVESLNRLRRKRKHMRFLTNDPCATRESACVRLHKLGIDVHIDEMITSSYATAQYLRVKGIRTVYVLSDEHLKKECTEVGMIINDYGCPDAVVVGWDSNITLREIQKAAQFIIKGASFIATSPDLTFPTKEGPALATGAVVEMLKAATGVHPDIVGKPHSAMFQAALQAFPEMKKEQVVMIGDNPLTDILGAHQFGITAILISKENTNPFPLKTDFRNPDFIIPNLKSLFEPNLRITLSNRSKYIWPNEVKAAVTAVIFNRVGDVLLIQRKDNQLWGLPTGHVEVGESVEQAVVREVLEETGLHVTVKRMIGVYSDPETQTLIYSDGRVTQFVTTCFECEVIDGILTKQTEESVDAAFFHPNELPTDLLHMHSSRINDAIMSRN